MSSFYTLLISLFFCLLARITSVSAQTFRHEVISTAGTFVGTPTASMAWTIGEVCIETYSNTNHFLTQLR